MPPPTDIQFTRFVGDTPAVGIVFARAADQSLRTLLGYSEALDLILMPHAVQVDVSAVDAAVVALRGQNISGGVSAQASIEMKTATVTAVLSARNGSNAGAYVGTTTNHSLSFLINGVARARLQADGSYRLLASAGQGASLAIDGAAGTPRYQFGMDSSAESSGAVGSYLYMDVFDNSGGYLDRSLIYTRNSLTWTFQQHVGITGRLGIGTAPGASAYSLDVFPDVTGGAALLRGSTVVLTQELSAFRVMNAGSVLFQISTAADITQAVYAGWSFYVGSGLTFATALFGVDCANEKVYVGKGYAYNVILDVHGPVYALGSFVLNGSTILDRVGAWTRVFDDSGYVIIEGGNASMGYRRALGGNTIEFYDRDYGVLVLYVDALNADTATQTALFLRIGGVLRRVQIKAGTALLAGDNVMVLV